MRGARRRSRKERPLRRVCRGRNAVTEPLCRLDSFLRIYLPLFLVLRFSSAFSSFFLSPRCMEVRLFLRDEKRALLRLRITRVSSSRFDLNVPMRHIGIGRNISLYKSYVIRVQKYYYI